MTGNDAIKKLDAYLKNYNIYHQKDFDQGCRRFTMVYDSPASPGGFVESCIWFFPRDHAEVGVYYNEEGAEICKASENRDDLMWLINYINGYVFLKCQDPNGMYGPSTLYTPRLFMSCDGGYDIVIKTMINYDFWELANIETLDYMTAYCPELLDRLAPAIFGVLRGDQTINEAYTYIDENVLED